MQRIQGIPENTKIKLVDMEDSQKNWLKKYVDISKEMGAAKQHIYKAELLCGAIFIIGVITALFILSNIDIILLIFGEIWSGVLLVALLTLAVYIGFVVVRETRHAKKVFKSLQTGDVFVEYLREGLRCKLRVYTEYCKFFEEEI